MKFLKTLILLVAMSVTLAEAQQSNIVESNAWTTSEDWGGLQLRYWGGNPVSAKITVNNIINGDGLKVIAEQHALARASGAYTVHRTMYNHHRTNHADQAGLTFKTMTHWDGSTGFVVDYDNFANLPIIQAIEQSIKDAAGVDIDAVQLGFGLLQENNFGPDPPPVSIDGMFAYFEVMKSVWGDKLQINIGGTFGPVDNPRWTRQILTRIAKTGHRFLGDFQDSWGRETWEGYNWVREIWTAEGIELPIISWREVTGGCNKWETHSEVNKTPAELYASALSNKQSFMHNMGCWPSYAGTDAFITATMQYLPGQVAEYRALIGAEPPPPPPSDPELERRVDTLSVHVAKLESQMKAIHDWMNQAPLYTKEYIGQ